MVVFVYPFYIGLSDLLFEKICLKMSICLLVFPSLCL